MCVAMSAASRTSFHGRTNETKYPRLRRCPTGALLSDKRSWLTHSIAAVDLQFTDLLEESISHIAANEGLKAAFLRPLYLPPSAWLEHIPFAFWIMSQHKPRVLVELGVHYGGSYFAFCQAVEALSLDARCYGVDRGPGDEHAGFYGDDIYEQVRARNHTLYSNFSSLIRAEFSDIARYFEDASVDLLHLDGFHTEESVRKDLETWMPKLSDRAVLLLHDTNVRERSFGVAKVLVELRQKYPVFEFVHGNGLGIVGIGKTQSPALEALFDADRQSSARRDIANFFGSLGHACSARATPPEALGEEKRVRATERLETRNRLADQSAHAAEVEQAAARAASETEALSEALASTRRERDELAEERSRLLARLDERERALSEASARAEKLKRLLGEAARDRKELSWARDALAGRAIAWRPR